MPSLTQKQIARFWGKIDKQNSQTFYNGTRCWEWTGGCSSHGYGEVWIVGKNRRVHRVSYELAYGEIPEGYDVLHHCDNRPCCRPEHLWLGNQQDNMDDKTQKGRGYYPGPISPSHGDEHYSRLHPERLSRGDKHGSRIHPEKLARGDANGSRLHPERLARGNTHGSHLHPENRPRGEEHGMSKLSDDKISAIRLRYDAGESQVSLAKEYGVHQTLISLIVRRKIWKQSSSS